MKVLHYADRNFLNSAFLGGPDNAFAAVITASSSTSVTYSNPHTGRTTTLTGSGLQVDGSGQITGGTISRISFDHFSDTHAIFKGISWSGVDFAAALAAMHTDGIAPMIDLLGTQPITWNASGFSDPDGSGDRFWLQDQTAPTVFIGSNKADYFLGTLADDTLKGGNSDDILLGDAGDDVLYGQSGDDTLFGGQGHDILFGGDGDDRLYGYYGRNRLVGGDGNDWLGGGEGRDKLYGKDGHDSLDGGARSDSMFGGTGDDTLAGGAGDDLMNGGDGIDILLGGKGFDILNGGLGHDTLDGGTGDDTLNGDLGDDLLRGRTGSDILNGGAGLDKLYGGMGDDTLTGGTDADKFIFASSQIDDDTITDFEDDVDTLKLDDALWTGTLTVAQVISTYASVDAGNVVINFGSGQKITLLGLTDTALLLDDLVIF